MEQSDSSKTNRAKLDSHANNYCAGVNTSTPFTYLEETISISPFIDEYSPLKDILEALYFG
jgi:hypothetical protein